MLFSMPFTSNTSYLTTFLLPSYISVWNSCHALSTKHEFSELDE